MLQVLMLLMTLFAPLFSLDKFDQSQCGRSKSCLRWSSCDFATCDFGFSWKIVDYNSLKYLETEIIGTMDDSSNGFIALGFNRKNLMSDSGVVACRMQNGQLNISCGYNGNQHRNTLFQSSDVDENFLITQIDPIYGVEYDGVHKVLRCRFLRKLTPNLNHIQLMDLSIGNYYIVSSKGTRNSNTTLSYHGKNRRLSPSSYDINSPYTVNNIITNSYSLVKIHACFMIVGWILFATNGIFIAFFYKNNWPDKSINGEKLWFQFHRLLQSSCVICVVTGFIVIFVHVGRYSTLGSLPDSAHPILGITATSLLLINPLIALFRCKPNAERRWLFNLIHFVVGMSAYILALTTMAIGIHLSPAGPDLANMFMPYTIVIVFISVMILFFVAEVLRKVYRNRNNGIDSADSVNSTYKLGDSKDYHWLISKITTGAARNNIIIDSVASSVIVTIVLIVLVLIY